MKAGYDYIDITIDGDGNVSGEVVGAQGKNCVGVLDELLGRLGRITRHIRTRSFYERATTRARRFRQVGGKQ